MLLDIACATKSPTAAFLLATTASLALDSQSQGSTRRALAKGINAGLYVARRLERHHD